MDESFERSSCSVSEVNEMVRERLEGDFRFRRLLIRGELSNYKIYPSGHHYFTLKDQESSLRCVMFRGNAQHLRFRPENGMKVTVTGDLRVFSRDGVYQIYCSDISPEGQGDLQLAFEQLKQKLFAEGLFAESAKKPIPVYPERVAIITSSAGAAVHDMIRIFGQRWPLTKLLLLPVRVQGPEAPAEIAGAIRYANEFRVADLIITGRGGGSLEDLWAFNDERVARAIFASQIPVISAVGHEPDVTIADFVADRRASTPSNAAEIAVPDRNKTLDLLMNLEVRLVQTMNKTLTRDRQRLNACADRRVLRDGAAILDPKRQELDLIQEKLTSAMREKLSLNRTELAGRAAALDAMSPLKVLGRGYALATKPDGKLLHSVNDAEEGERVKLRLSDGALSCRVEGRDG